MTSILLPVLSLIPPSNLREGVSKWPCGVELLTGYTTTYGWKENETLGIKIRCAGTFECFQYFSTHMEVQLEV